jgi:hypothetical protein
VANPSPRSQLTTEIKVGGVALPPALLLPIPGAAFQDAATSADQALWSEVPSTSLPAAEAEPRVVDPFASVLPIQLMEPVAAEEWEDFVGPLQNGAGTSAGEQDTGELQVAFRLQLHLIAP